MVGRSKGMAIDRSDQINKRGGLTSGEDRRAIGRSDQINKHGGLTSGEDWRVGHGSGIP